LAIIATENRNNAVPSVLMLSARSHARFAFRDLAIVGNVDFEAAKGLVPAEALEFDLGGGVPSPNRRFF